MTSTTVCFTNKKDDHSHALLIACQCITNKSWESARAACFILKRCEKKTAPRKKFLFALSLVLCPPWNPTAFTWWPVRWYNSWTTPTSSGLQRRRPGCCCGCWPTAAWWRSPPWHCCSCWPRRGPSWGLLWRSSPFSSHWWKLASGFRLCAASSHASGVLWHFARSFQVKLIYIGQD